jgi:cell division protein FtsW
MLKYLMPIWDREVREWSPSARWLRWLTFLWLSIGLIALFSASYPVGEAESGDALYYFKRQILWCLLGMVGFNFIVRLPLSRILKFSGLIFLTLLGLMLVTLFLGTEVNGATRWLSLGPFALQPSELIKPFLVLQSAQLFGKWNKLSWPFRVTWLIIFALLLASILLQPNLSTTALCGITLWLIALAAGIPYLYLFGTALTGIGVAALSLSINEYQRLRVQSFLNPWADAQGNGYQLVQSLLAIGSGGPFGAGFGLSQQKLFYLPIQYTDFIFSVFAEEFGFVGSVFLLLLVISYGTLALIVAIKCTDIVNRLIAVGVMVLMVGQSLLNIGVAAGALPTTGLPFPLFSYGGSSSIASLCLAALLIRVARESDRAEVLPLKAKTK